MKKYILSLSTSLLGLGLLICQNIYAEDYYCDKSITCDSSSCTSNGPQNSWDVSNGSGSPNLTPGTYIFSAAFGASGKTMSCYYTLESNVGNKYDATKAVMLENVVHQWQPDTSHGNWASLGTDYQCFNLESTESNDTQQCPYMSTSSPSPH